MNDKYTSYTNPLVTRYASQEMSYLFSEQRRIGYFRRLWLALAKGEKTLGLNITQEQINELEANLDNIDFAAVAERERVVRHDVMAHIHAYGLVCPKAAPIIHLGATSCYVTDNADIIMYREGLNLVISKLVSVIDRLSKFAKEYKDLPTMGFTHYQPAQLVTVGKRASLWLQELVLDYHNLVFVRDNLMFRGVKGATGTQASFVTLFEGDTAKVDALDEYITEYFGFKKVFPVTGQTYSRKVDYSITSVLSMLAQSAHKFSLDLRLLQHMKEVEEPFEKSQIGSSAMAYKRNPMRSERITSLARYLISLPLNTAMTASVQGFERTLDDSANRRIVMGQAFLTADAILDLLLNVTDGLVVYKKIIDNHIKVELPFMATEVILMECVKAGGDRQELHEKIRAHSMAAEKMYRETGEPKDLINRLKQDPAFQAIKDYDKLLNPSEFTARAGEQVIKFLESEVAPILKKHQAELGRHAGEIKI